MCGNWIFALFYAYFISVARDYYTLTKEHENSNTIQFKQKEIELDESHLNPTEESSISLLSATIEGPEGKGHIEF